MLQKDNSFLNISSIDQLCSILNISRKQLYYILFIKRKKYRKFEIAKKSGGKRIILAPSDDLKSIQRKLAHILYNCYDFLDVQHGFIKNKSCVTNAWPHIGKRFVLNIDLNNFFDTIHFGRIQGLFMNKPFYFNRNLATILAKIVCDEGRLPQGAPTSPVLSNIICYKMDKDLNHLAQKNRCVYTRYADDITFSTNSEKFPSQIANILSNEVVLSNKLINTINGGYENGFSINPSKTKLSKNMMHQEVTGITVNAKLNVNKKYIKKIRAIMHSIKKCGFLATAKKNYKIDYQITEEQSKVKMFNLLQGKLNYLKMVRGYNDKLFLKYAEQFNKTFSVDFFDIDNIMELEKYAMDRCFVLQSQGEDSQGTAFLTKDKLYTSTHILINATTYKEFIYDEKDEKFLLQFPIAPSDGTLPFFVLKNNNYKIFLNYMINVYNYKTDILSINNVNINSKIFKVAKNSSIIGETVYLIGFPGFVDFERTSLFIIETKVIGKSTFLGRKFLVTKDSPLHGMSGGPVLNEKREVVGIVYAGADMEDDYDSDKVGFINLI